MGPLRAPPEATTRGAAKRGATAWAPPSPAGEGKTTTTNQASKHYALQGGPAPLEPPSITGEHQMKAIYAVRDRLAESLVGNQAYALLLFHNDTVAIRYFADAIADETSILNKHPADYELIRVGGIHDNGELLTDSKDPQIIITGDALIAAQNKPLAIEA